MGYVLPVINSILKIFMSLQLSEFVSLFYERPEA